MWSGQNLTDLTSDYRPAIASPSEKSTGILEYLKPVKKQESIQDVLPNPQDHLYQEIR